MSGVTLVISQQLVLIVAWHAKLWVTANGETKGDKKSKVQDVEGPGLTLRGDAFPVMHNNKQDNGG